MLERLSYFMTVIVAALGWLLTHYVDRITSSPTIEYAIHERTGGSAHFAVYSLTNVNRTTGFGPLTVEFLARGNSPIDRLAVVPVEPASEGRMPNQRDLRLRASQIPSLMPGSTVYFVVQTRGPRRPEMRIDAPVAIRLTTGSLETWLARNELAVVARLILLWALILAVIVVIQLRLARSKADDEERANQNEGGANVALV